jgi:signal transduction histidine kinase
MSDRDHDELVAKAELLDLLLSATQDGIVDWNLVTGEATYNPRWKHLLGFDNEELNEYHETPGLWRELIHADDLPGTLKLLSEHLEQAWPFTTTVRMRYRYGGHRHILCRGAAHRDADDRPVRMVIVFSDVDDRLRFEERQRALMTGAPDQQELEDQLLLAQKLDTISQLSASVAHEICTPLKVMTDHLELVSTAMNDLIRLNGLYRRCIDDAAAGPPSPAARDELRKAEAEANLEHVQQTLPTELQHSIATLARSTDMLQALASFARPSADQPTVTDLLRLIENSVILTTHQWKCVADLELSLAPDLPLVPCIASEIHHVLLSLIRNAARAIAEAAGSSGKRGKLVISATSDATHAEIRVFDAGAGIAEHTRAELFEPSLETEERAIGSRQGLALAFKCVVERHKGKLDYETQLGVGTTFVMRLPLVPDP